MRSAAKVEAPQGYNSLTARLSALAPNVAVRKGDSRETESPRWFRVVNLLDFYQKKI